MSNRDFRIFYFIAIASINFIALVLGVLVGMSNIFANSKYGLFLLIISLAVAAVCFLVYFRDKRQEEQFSRSYSAVVNENNNAKKTITDLEAKNKRLATDLQALNDSPIKENYEALKVKCDSIEAFRNSFPLNIAPGYAVYNIIRTNITAGQCSNWKIIGMYADELWECDIIRPETQLYKDMLTAVVGTKKPDEIQALNVGNEIFWA